MLELTAIGTLGKKPEIKQSQGGKNYVNFSLSCRADGEEHNIWVDCVAFEKTADLICQYGDKGTRLFVRGKPKSNSYISKESGEIVQKMQILVQKWEIVSGKPKDGEGNTAAPIKKSDSQTHEYIEEEDVPF